MSEITTLAIDLAKHVFQLHGVDQRGVCTLRPTEAVGGAVGGRL